MATIKGIIKMKKKTGESISSLHIDSQMITSAEGISNYFNNFFTSVAKKILSSQQKKNTLILPWP